MAYRLGLFLIMVTIDPLILCSNDMHHLWVEWKIEKAKSQGCVFLKFLSPKVLFSSVRFKRGASRVQAMAPPGW